jgi:nitrous oxidase accessory protein NosD
MSSPSDMAKGRGRGTESSRQPTSTSGRVVRMRRWTKTVIVLMLGLLLGLPATAAWAGHSRVRVVRPGQSIQAAIDAARPGDTILVKPGTYAEALTVTTDDLTLKGSRGTVLTMPDDAEPCLVFDPTAPPTVDGVCVLGEFSPEFEVTDPVENFRISGFVIRGFSANGIFALATEDLRVTRILAEDNAEYGIFALLSTRPVLAHNQTTGSGVAGLYVGSNQEADAKIFGNKSWDNPLGIFLRDVSHGTVTGNHVFGNCTGILLLANAPGPVTNWRLRHNLVRANNRECGGEDPPPSGVGILLLGASDNEVSKNLVLGNRSEDPRGGGIVLITAEPEPGVPDGEAVAPSGNLVSRNIALRNRPFDIFWDGTGAGNRFVRNLCRTSQPADLCD